MIAVVGGGLIGGSVAFELAQGGADVVILDADKAGAAWPAGAGMLTPLGERLGGTSLEPLAAASLRLWNFQNLCDVREVHIVKSR